MNRKSLIKRSRGRRPSKKRYSVRRELSVDYLEDRRLLTAPQIVGVVPMANSHDAAAEGAISITFDQIVDPATVSNTTTAVHAMQSGYLVGLAAELTVRDKTITVMPATPLHTGELVQVTAANGIGNESGETFEQPRVWQFRIAARSGKGTFLDSQQDFGRESRSRVGRFGRRWGSRRVRGGRGTQQDLDK